ncbi:efflux RND transporter periplasmic adaptor subunit [Rivibacter subsaxonicus]|uniref:RND family efflux transporter MFP subunit n=1 Tax=Rivibacter subsaxonicus TaxID=457575 RepID=A0A4Q7VWR5_9BURK|nr:efflux RND transporter periplasmic adaptor subunit [Rivibacter subsaxonicus]RZU01171.1 RND family efflux transporter MFP subunit [Rivibacter subsaxonicus]
MSEAQASSPAAANPASRLSQLKIDRGGPKPGRKRRRWGLWIAVAVGITAAAAVALRPRAPEVQTSSVLLSTPSQQYAQLTASGYVVAQRRAAVASKATGRLLELNVREGSRVKKGDLIARVDASDVQAQIDAASAGVRQAEAAVKQAQAEAANAEAELKRNQQLVAQGFLSPAALDVSTAKAASARAAIASAQAAVGQGQAQLKLQQVNRDFTEIRAPFDGVVLVKNANVGDIITPFSSAAGSLGSVVTMADMGTLEVEADVSESNLAKARIGQPVEITLDALPDKRFRGKVATIVPTVDRAKATVMTKIQFEQLDPGILPDMSAKVSFLSQAVSDADLRSVIAVNPATVVERDGKKLVFRVGKPGKDGEAPVVQALAVTPGRMLGESLEVSGNALKSGDKLVLNPPAELKDGQAVRIAAGK